MNDRNDAPKTRKLYPEEIKNFKRMMEEIERFRTEDPEYYERELKDIQALMRAASLQLDYPPFNPNDYGNVLHLDDEDED